MPCNDQEYRKMPPKELKQMLKRIGRLSRAGMEAGNRGDFKEAFFQMDLALSCANKLGKKCLEAKLLNNIGILYTLQGKWDAALLNYDKSIGIVSDHYGMDNILFKTLQKNMACLFSGSHASSSVN